MELFLFCVVIVCNQKLFTDMYQPKCIYMSHFLGKCVYSMNPLNPGHCFLSYTEVGVNCVDHIEKKVIDHCANLKDVQV